MLGLIIGAISWAFNFLLDLIPGKIRAALSDAVISVLQPMLMPVVYANMFPDIITRMAIGLQLQYVPLCSTAEHGCAEAFPRRRKCSAWWQLPAECDDGLHTRAFAEAPWISTLNQPWRSKSSTR